MSTKKRLAAYGMAATAAIGGGIGGLAIGLGLPSGQAEITTVPTELAASTGAAALPVHAGGGGAARVDRLAVAAQALGISADELRTALEGGKSMAQVAQERNVDVQKVIDAIIAAGTAAIDRAVTDGTLTRAQADERKAGLPAHVKAKVERVGPGGHGGPGGAGRGGSGGAHVDRLAVAAKALGISADELRTALAGGRSMAQVAQERNVDVQKVIDAVVAAGNAALDQAVKDGRLTQAQADEKKANLATRVKADVERVGFAGPGGPGGPGRGGHGHGPGGPGPGRPTDAPAGTAATPAGVVVN